MNQFLSYFKLLLFSCVFLFLMVSSAYGATHLVNKGESLFLISKLYQVPLSILKYTNKLQADTIYPGQRLFIPEKYFIRKGDTLSLIAKLYNISYQEIIFANNLKSTVIYPDNLLFIPVRNNVYVHNSQVSRGGGLYSNIWYTLLDLDLLARLITAEADSESYKTKVAVGAVVLNRVLSPEFPNNIPDVVNQVVYNHYQFEPVLNGWINRPASREAVQAAKDALKGADPSRGSLYFFESWVTNKFLKSRPVSVILDSFTFTY